MNLIIYWTCTGKEDLEMDLVEINSGEDIKL